MELKEPVRVSARISARANEWLDKRSYEMSVSKSALISLAVEEYIKQYTVSDNIPDLMKAIEQIRDVQSSASEG